jgi:hypothetical protein
VLVSVGLLGNTEGFSFSNVKNFTRALSDSNISCTSLIDCVVDLTAFVLDNGLLAWKHKDLSPLYYKSGAEYDMTARYRRVMEFESTIKPRNYSTLTGDDLENYQAQVEESIEEHKLAVALSGGRPNPIIERQLRELYRLSSSIKTQIVNSFRKAPFGVLFYGQSNVGKSTVSMYVAKAMLMALGLNTDDRYSAVVDPSKRFQDTLTSDIHHIILDDINNVSARYADAAVSDLIIKIFNNVPFAANKADLEDKGKVSVSPAIVTGTTNDKTLGAFEYSNEPYSIIRRFNYVVTVTVKPEFRAKQEDGVLKPDLDGEKAGAAFSGCVSDCWDFCVEKSFPVECNDGTTGFSFEPVAGYEKVGIWKLMQFMVDQCVKYRSRQTSLAKRNAQISSLFSVEDGKVRPTKVTPMRLPDSARRQMESMFKPSLSVIGEDEPMVQDASRVNEYWRGSRVEYHDVVPCWEVEVPNDDALSVNDVNYSERDGTIGYDPSYDDDDDEDTTVEIPGESPPVRTVEFSNPVPGVHTPCPVMRTIRRARERRERTVELFYQFLCGEKIHPQSSSSDENQQDDVVYVRVTTWRIVNGVPVEVVADVPLNAWRDERHR